MLKKNFSFLKNIGFALFFVCVFFSSFKWVFAFEENYVDFIVKIHMGKIEGQLYSFPPENSSSSWAFENDYTPSIDTNYSANRDYAQSVWIELTNFGINPSNFSSYQTALEEIEAAKIAGTVLEVKDILLVNTTEYLENADWVNSDFLISPIDGFLHFKIKKDYFEGLSNPMVQIIQPSPKGLFCVLDAECQANTLERYWVTRGLTPYGFFESDWLYSQIVNPQSLAEANLGIDKIVVDLVMVRNFEEQMTNQNFDLSSDWTVDPLVTFSQKFVIRGFELLDWVLKIDNSGIEHSSIITYYKKILSAINALLIVILLTIALLWNFSFFITGERLRKMMVTYFIVVIVVNFSVPLVRLSIDTANMLQNVFLYTQDPVSKTTRKIVAKDFFNYGWAEYENLKWYALENSTCEFKEIISTWTLDTGVLTPDSFSLYGTIPVPHIFWGWSPMSLATSIVEEPFSASGSINTEIDTFNVVTQVPVDERFEDRFYNSLMLILTGLGYFLLSGVFLFRMVILWFLIILSPFLFLLLIFPFLKWYFRYWMWLFTRWIVIGPILAMCLGASVFIWKKIGIPITSLYSSAIEYPQSTNVKIGAPGMTIAGLNYTKPMAEYLIALIMLYMPVILAFWLTRRLNDSPFSKNESNSFFGFKSQDKYGNLSSSELQNPEQNLEQTKTTPPESFSLGKYATKMFGGDEWKFNFSNKKITEPSLGNLNTNSVQQSFKAIPSFKDGINKENILDQIPKIDTQVLAEMLNLHPITNQNRNNSLAELSNLGSVTNQVRKNNLQGIKNELIKRTQGWDKIAKGIIDELSSVWESLGREAQEDGIQNQDNLLTNEKISNMKSVTKSIKNEASWNINQTDVLWKWDVNLAENNADIRNHFELDSNKTWLEDVIINYEKSRSIDELT